MNLQITASRPLSHPFLVAAALACAQFLAADEASAETMAPIAAAVDRCQPALPVYEGNIRKRPKAVQNEGSATAFVTCGFRGDNLDEGMYYVVARVINNSNAPLTIACTLVPGEFADTENHMPDSVTVPAGSSSFVSWNYNDYENQRFGKTAAISCALPPGAGIAYLMNYYTTG